MSQKDRHVPSANGIEARVAELLVRKTTARHLPQRVRDIIALVREHDDQDDYQLVPMRDQFDALAGEVERLHKGLNKAVADPATEWVDANIIRLLLDRSAL
jgi:hypothetical protein